MPTCSSTNSDSNCQGRRAEEVASWYFRLNGFLQIPSFILHSEQARQAITDADLIGVRFPYSSESLQNIDMADDGWIVSATQTGQTLFTIVEVKKARCKVNGPWKKPEKGGMEKVIRRIGFAPDKLISDIAKGLYDKLQWQNDNFLVQYVAVGDETNSDLTHHYPELKQLIWDEIAQFLFERFDNFGDLKGSHSQWPCFGKRFARKRLNGSITCPKEASLFIVKYIENGAKKPK